MNETNGFLPLNDALQYPEVREFLNTNLASNEQLYLYVRNNYSPRYGNPKKLVSASILEFFNDFKGLYLLGRYVKFYKKKSSEIYGFSFYIEEKKPDVYDVTFGTIYLGEGDIPLKMKEGIIEDISYVLNKTKRLSFLTTINDKALPLYKSICHVAKCGSCCEGNNGIISIWMGLQSYEKFGKLYYDETMSEEDWKHFKTRILNDIELTRILGGFELARILEDIKLLNSFWRILIYYDSNK